MTNNTLDEILAEYNDPDYYQRLSLSKEDALKLAAETHVICGIVGGEIRIKPKEERTEERTK